MKKLNVLLLALGVIASAQLNAGATGIPAPDGTPDPGSTEFVIEVPASAPNAPIVQKLGVPGYQQGPVEFSGQEPANGTAQQDDVTGECPTCPQY